MALQRLEEFALSFHLQKGSLNVEQLQMGKSVLLWKLLLTFRTRRTDDELSADFADSSRITMLWPSRNRPTDGKQQ